MARLCPLFSGSGGNSYYIGSRSAGLLIDAGRSARQLDRMLQRCGIDPMAIQASSSPTSTATTSPGCGCSPRSTASRCSLPGDAAGHAASLEGVESWVLEGPLQLAGMEVTPFATPHDSAQSLGFRIQTADGRQFALATDLGGGDALRAGAPAGGGVCGAGVQPRPGDAAQRALPGYLKRRILAGTGHLSNGDCAAFLPELARAGAKRFLLAHLSGENNTPSLARQEAVSALSAAGYQEGTGFWLDVAPVENQEGKSIIF